MQALQPPHHRLLRQSPCLHLNLQNLWQFPNQQYSSNSVSRWLRHLLWPQFPSLYPSLQLHK